MIKLDDDLLQQLGLAALPPEEKKKLLAHIYETLEMRVGMKLAEQMSNEQLAEFEQFIDSNNESGALQWLETNFPNYKDVVAAEFEKLKAEIAQVAPQILMATQAQAQQQMAQQPMPQQDPAMYGQPPQQMPPQPMQPPMPSMPPQAPYAPQQPAYPMPQPPAGQQMPPSVNPYGQPQQAQQPMQGNSDDYRQAS